MCHALGTGHYLEYYFIETSALSLSVFTATEKCQSIWYKFLLLQVPCTQ